MAHRLHARTDDYGLLDTLLNYFLQQNKYITEIVCPIKSYNAPIYFILFYINFLFKLRAMSFLENLKKSCLP